MSGYREHSYDPMANEGLGRPLRPYNKVQWLGVGLQLLAILAYGYYFATKAGWVADLGFDPMLLGLPLLLVGMSLTYSRREGQHDLAPELAAERKRWLFITLGICGALLGVAVAIEFSGA